jgi:DNA adenine methylase
MLEDLHVCLAAGAIFGQLPFDAFIVRHDRPGTVFLLDPPYWGCEDDYGQGMFSRADFERLREVLGGLKGRFILTINDRPETRELFAGFEIDGAAVTYSLSGAPTQAKELIVRGGG